MGLNNAEMCQLLTLMADPSLFNRDIISEFDASQLQPTGRVRSSCAEKGAGLTAL